MNKVYTLQEAVADIPANATVASTGVIGWITPDALLKAIGDRFEQTQAPRDLTFYFPCGTGDAMHIGGMDRVAKKGLLKRLISGSYINPVHPETGERPKVMQMIHRDEVEAYTWPIATTMHWLREVARRSPGYLTKTGLGTFVDPRETGGKFTPSAQEDLVERVNFKGEDYLFYPTWDLHYGILRASSADESGNLSFENEALTSSNLAIAAAVKACGGTVIAQVQKIVPRGSRSVHAIGVPGSLVDRVVVVEDQAFCTEIALDPNYLGEQRIGVDQLPKPAPSADKIIAARAAQEVRKHELSIFGFGASGDIPLVMAEQGKLDGDGIYDYEFTTEHGSFGGVVMSGWQFSANINPEAVIDGISQFDVIEGGLCKLAALAFAEFDSVGTVNVSKFGRANPGSGGFINIAHNAERLVFTGTFTTGGLKTCVVDGKLRIDREGSVKKFVQQAQHITYRVREGVKDREQEVLLVTERAVFRVVEQGLILIEIAPGIDLERDILAQMDFEPYRVLENLPLMDARLFQENYVE
ncbi:MAG: acyl CoA:acetate/3-ketoacid CoA transferase [Pseudomonadales bacterium]